jgi:phage shock protein A
MEPSSKLGASVHYSGCDRSIIMKSRVPKILTADEEAAKIREQSIIDLQEDLIKSRQAVAQSIAAAKRQERQYNQRVSESHEWEKRSILALQEGDKNLARESLSHKKAYSEAATTLKAGLDQHLLQVDILKQDLVAIESKIYKAKCAVGVLICVEHSFKERSFELDFSADDPDTEFARLEDDGSAAELAAIRAKMMTSSPEAEGALPPSDAARNPGVDEAIDAELELLRRQIQNLPPKDNC